MPSQAEAVAVAVAQELVRLRAAIDGAKGLRAVTLSIKFTAGAGVRAVVTNVETEHAFARNEIPSSA